jgi:hypothetical protein
MNVEDAVIDAYYPRKLMVRISFQISFQVQIIAIQGRFITEMAAARKTDVVPCTRPVLQCIRDVFSHDARWGA